MAREREPRVVKCSSRDIHTAQSASLRESLLLYPLRECRLQSGAESRVWGCGLWGRVRVCGTPHPLDAGGRHTRARIRERHTVVWGGRAEISAIAPRATCDGALALPAKLRLYRPPSLRAPRRRTGLRGGALYIQQVYL